MRPAQGLATLVPGQAPPQGARDALEQRVSAYLMGIPLLSDYLEEGLSLFGLGCEDTET